MDQPSLHRESGGRLANKRNRADRKFQGEKKYSFTTELTVGGFVGSTDRDAYVIAPEERLSKYLAKHWTRILDLFRRWDTNQDGLISRKEFTVGMMHLSLLNNEEEAAKLYDSYDTDHSGTLTFAEPNAQLRQKAEAVSAYELRPNQRTLLPPPLPSARARPHSTISVGGRLPLGSVASSAPTTARDLEEQKRSSVSAPAR